MKLVCLFLLFSPIAGFSHEMKSTPRAVRDHLNDESIKTSRLNCEPIKFLLKAYDSSDVQEQIAGIGVKPRTTQIASTLINAKRVTVLDSRSGHQWDYCAGLFKCEYPKTKLSFNVWVLLKAVKAVEDADKVSQRIVNSDRWKGLEFRSVGDSELLIIGNTLSDDLPIKIDGKLVYFRGSSCIYIDEEGNAIVNPLPSRSYMEKKGVNGFIEYWWPFSSQYLVASMKTSTESDYGDRVTDVRIFFYDVKSKKMARLPLTLNVEKLSKQPALKLNSGKKIHIVTEALERPIRVVSLRDGTRALRMYLPSAENRKAGKFLLIPKF